MSIESNEHLIYHPGLSSTKAAKKFGCFGILSGKPLQTIAPFELYDDIKHKQSQDFKTSHLGIMNVTIVPVKSMIRLDRKQILGNVSMLVTNVDNFRSHVGDNSCHLHL